MTPLFYTERTNILAQEYSREWKNQIPSGGRDRVHRSFNLVGESSQLIFARCMSRSGYDPILRSYNYQRACCNVLLSELSRPSPSS